MCPRVYLCAALIVVCLSGTIQKWDLFPSQGVQPDRRNDFGMEIMGDKLVLFGGANFEQNILHNDLYLFDLVKRQWETPFVDESHPVPRARERFAHALCDGVFWVYGGREKKWLHDLWGFDFFRHEWIDGGVMDEKIEEPKMVCQNDKVLWIHGYNHELNRQAFVYYNIDTKENAMLTPHALRDVPTDLYNYMYIKEDQRTVVMLINEHSRGGFTDSLIEIDLEFMNYTSLSTAENLLSAYPNPGWGGGVARQPSGHFYMWGGWNWDANAFIPNNKIYGFDPVTGLWTFVGDFDARFPPRSNTAGAVWKDLLIAGLGWGHTIYNDLAVFNLTSRKSELIHGSNIVPPARGGHCVAVVANEMIVFGGRTHDTVLRDMWARDISSSTWRLVPPPKGKLPQRRYDHSCDALGFNIWMFAGRNFELMFGDVWRYNTRLNIWTEYVPIGASNWPEDRYQHLAWLSASFLYILGGRALGEGFDDMWRFNLYTFKWETVNQTNAPGPIASAATDNFNQLLISCGGRRGSLSRDECIAFNVTTNTWSLFSTLPSPVTSMSMVVSGSNVVIFGGENSGYIDDNLWVHGLKSGRWTEVAQSKKPVARVFYSLISFEDQIHIFGGFGMDEVGRWSYTNPLRDSFVLSIPVTASCDVDTMTAPGRDMFALPPLARVVVVQEGEIIAYDSNSGKYTVGFTTSPFKQAKYPLSSLRGGSKVGQRVTVPEEGEVLNTISEGVYTIRLDSGVILENIYANTLLLPEGCYVCADGSVETGVATSPCAMCPKGYYWDNDECNACPPGVFGPTAGMVGRGMCLPCPGGHYCPENATLEVLACPANGFCPSGSAVPRSEAHTEDPQFGHRRSCEDEAQPDCWQLPQTFEGHHERMLQIKRDIGSATLAVLTAVVVVALSIPLLPSHRKKYANIFQIFDLWGGANCTAIGGLFSIGFVVSFILVFIAFLVPFVDDNLLQTQSLLSVLNITVTSNLTLTTKFDLNLGDCSRENVLIELRNIKAGDYTVRQEQSSKHASVKCFVEWVCIGCTVSADSEVSMTILDTDQKVGARKIEYHARATSAYPGQDTVVWGVMRPTTPTNLFRGAPTVIHVVAVPTRYQAYVNSSEALGYHLQHGKEELGLHVESEQFGNHQHVGLSFHLSAALDLIQVDVRPKMTGAVFFALLLGLYAGLEKVTNDFKGQVLKIAAFLSKPIPAPERLPVVNLEAAFKKAGPNTGIAVEDDENGSWNNVVTPQPPSEAPKDEGKKPPVTVTVTVLQRVKRSPMESFFLLFFFIIHGAKYVVPYVVLFGFMENSSRFH